METSQRWVIKKAKGVHLAESDYANDNYVKDDQRVDSHIYDKSFLGVKVIRNDINVLCIWCIIVWIDINLVFEGTWICIEVT